MKIDFSEKDDAVSYTNLNDIEDYFVNELDSDGDGYLDKKELSKWVQPDGFQGVSSMNWCIILNEIYKIYIVSNNFIQILKCYRGNQR